MSQNSINNKVGSATNTNNLEIEKSASGLMINMLDQTDTFGVYNNAGTPEGVIAADIGSVCLDTTNGDMYLKQTDTVNTGWSLVGGTSTLSVNEQIFFVNGTYTPTVGMIYCKLECVGSGGGSGGVINSAAGISHMSAGGGGGEYASILATAATIGASQAVTIGAVGNAGTAAGTAGTAGGASSVGVICVANGGAGGAGQVAAGNVTGGAGGTGGTGSVTIDGEQGGIGYFTATASFTPAGGEGGSSHWSGRTIGVTPAGASVTGVGGVLYGAGGAGGLSFNALGAVQGGQGGQGIVAVTEFILS